MTRSFWVAIAPTKVIPVVFRLAYSPSATEIFHGGLRIPPVKLADGFGLREDILRMVCENTRKPEDTHGDILAMLASVDVGAERLNALLNRYGTDRIDLCSAKILDAGSGHAGAYPQWKPGVYKSVSYLDNDGVSTERYPVPVTVTVRKMKSKSISAKSATRSPPILTVRSRIRAPVSMYFFYLSNDQQVLNEGSAGDKSTHPQGKPRGSCVAGAGDRMHYICCRRNNRIGYSCDGRRSMIRWLRVLPISICYRW